MFGITKMSACHRHYHDSLHWKRQRTEGPGAGRGAGKAHHQYVQQKQNMQQHVNNFKA